MPLFVRAGAIIPLLPDEIDTLIPRHAAMSKDVIAVDDRRVLQVRPRRSKQTVHQDGNVIGSIRTVAVHVRARGTPVIRRGGAIQKAQTSLQSTKMTQGGSA